MDSASVRPQTTIHGPLPPGPLAAHVARQAVARILASPRVSCPEGVADDILLIVSELAANAVRHAEGPYALTVTVEPGRAGIAVSDASSIPPRPRSDGNPLATSGRGLAIVRMLGALLYASQSPCGKQVIAVITWHPRSTSEQSAPPSATNNPRRDEHLHATSAPSRW
ncbi:ATP-binding protein [Streptomyces sp. NPDC002773]|uniref:ATP-binding protein n=1 Tax=Streptomyces sp. NPDC002773 TaxID=3154430 RepID=UPI00331CCEFD